MIRARIFVPVVAIMIAAVLAAGMIVGRVTKKGAANTNATTDASPSATFAVDPQYDGRVLLMRNDCNGDGTVTGSFRWTVAAGTETQNYRIAIGPGDDALLVGSRETAAAQANLGGMSPGKVYAVTVFKPGFEQIWASSSFTPPSCDEYATACPPSADLISQGPVSGATTDTTARVWVRSCYGAEAVVEYKRFDAQWNAAQATPPTQMDPAHDNTAVFFIEGLTPSTRYDYRIKMDGLYPDQPAAHFSTLPVAGSPAKFRFLTTSDDHQFRTQNRPQPANTFANMAKSQPLFEMFLGDQMSGDDFGPFNPTSKEAYLRQYRDNWAYGGFRTLIAGVSTLMMWDDHDILNDWDARGAAPYPFARAAFEDFVSRQNPPAIRPNGTYFTFDAGDVSFFVLDVRSYRDKKNAPDNRTKSMLGAEQKAELKQWLKTSTAKFKFITSGVPFNDHQTVPLKKNDGWDGFTTEREEIFKFIRDNRIGGVILISGDAHWPGVFKLSYGIPEFQTTPAGVIPPNPAASVEGAPDVIFKDGMKNVFGRFDVDTTANPARVDFAMVDSTGAELYKTSLTAADLAQ